MATPATISRTTELSDSQYKWGFVTDVETDIAPKGISEDIVRLISAKKDEPEWLLEWRLKSLAHWFKMAESAGEPEWANLRYPQIDFQDMYYYAAPVTAEAPKSLDEVDPEMLEALKRLVRDFETHDCSCDGTPDDEYACHFHRNENTIKIIIKKAKG